MGFGEEGGREDGGGWGAGCFGFVVAFAFAEDMRYAFIWWESAE